MASLNVDSAVPGLKQGGKAAGRGAKKVGWGSLKAGKWTVKTVVKVAALLFIWMPVALWLTSFGPLGWVAMFALSEVLSLYFGGSFLKWLHGKVTG